MVVAPVGKKHIDSGDVEALLNQMVRGTGDAIAHQDRPRVRIWPAQLSSKATPTLLYA